MSLLQALNLPRIAAVAPTAVPAVDSKAIEQSKQQFDTVFKSAIAYAATLGEDKPVQATLIKALVACDAKRREANQLGAKDPAKQNALLDAAVASVSVSRTQGEEAIAKARATGGDKPEAARATSKPSTTVAQALGTQNGGEDDHGHDDAPAALAAGRKSGGDVAKSTTVNEKTGPLPGEKTTTTTTAGVDQGVAHVNRTTDTRGVGAEGVSVGQKVETERATAEGSLKKTSDVKGTLGPEGLKVEAKKGSEYKGKDGRTRRSTPKGRRKSAWKARRARRRRRCTGATAARRRPPSPVAASAATARPRRSQVRRTSAPMRATPRRRSAARTSAAFWRERMATGR